MGVVIKAENVRRDIKRSSSWNASQLPHFVVVTDAVMFALTTDAVISTTLQYKQRTMYLLPCFLVEVN